MVDNYVVHKGRGKKSWNLLTWKIFWSNIKMSIGLVVFVFLVVSKAGGFSSIINKIDRFWINICRVVNKVGMTEN